MQTITLQEILQKVKKLIKMNRIYPMGQLDALSLRNLFHSGNTFLVE